MSEENIAFAKLVPWDLLNNDGHHIAEMVSQGMKQSKIDTAIFQEYKKEKIQGYKLHVEYEHKPKSADYYFKLQLKKENSPPIELAHVSFHTEIQANDKSQVGPYHLKNEKGGWYRYGFIESEDKIIPEIIDSNEPILEWSNIFSTMLINILINKLNLQHSWIEKRQEGGARRQTKRRRVKKHRSLRANRSRNSRL